MAYTDFEVVNECLALVGELPVNSLDTPHPLIPSAVAAITNQNTLVQSERWWFNVEYPTLTPQAGNKRIVLPGDTASVDTLTRTPETAARGGYLYNLTAGTYEFDAPVKVRLHRIVAFNDLPLSARRYIAVEAQLQFSRTLDADSQKVRDLKEERQRAYALMNAEHTRNSRVNMLNRPGVQYVLNQMQGLSPFAGRIKY